MVHIFNEACTASQRARLADWVTELRRTQQLVANPLGPHGYHRNIAELSWVEIQVVLPETQRARQDPHRFFAGRRMSYLRENKAIVRRLWCDSGRGAGRSD